LNPPKRAIGSFNWFVKDFIAAKTPDKFGPTAMVEAGKKWREIPDIEKQACMQEPSDLLQQW
jgi:hypothetical protein